MRPGAGFGQLEVLQNVVVAGRPVLAFTCDPQEQTAERIAEWGEYSTWSHGGDGFEIIDPIAVTLDAEGYLVAP